MSTELQNITTNLAPTPGSADRPRQHTRVENGADTLSAPRADKVNEAESAKAPEPTEKLVQAVDDLNRFVQQIQRDLQFNIDRDTGRTVIKVIDAETEKVIRQIPSDELLELSRRVEQAVGVILKAEA